MLTDYAKAENRLAWLQHPVLGGPSFDTFDHRDAPVHRGSEPYLWPVNGSLFRDDTGWYLLVGNYLDGYAVDERLHMYCSIYKSTDEGKTFTDSGPVFDDPYFTFRGRNSPSNNCPDAVITPYAGSYYLAYDWTDDAITWDTIFNPTKDCDSGCAIAISERPEGPYRRLDTPVFSNCDMQGRLGKFKRMYASTLIIRENDCLILGLCDSADYFSWGLAGMTAPAPEGPWSEPVLLLSNETGGYYPAPVEFYPCFVHEGKIYAPATSVAANRNYQAVFCVELESAMDPDAWQLVMDGSAWHSDPVENEYYGIWGQTYHGFIHDGVFNVMFPSRDEHGRGTINLASRQWDTPYRDGFILSAHHAPSLALLKAYYSTFVLEVDMTVKGCVTIFWAHRGPLGPDQPRSDATPNPLSLTDYTGIRFSNGLWQIVRSSKNQTELITQGPAMDETVRLKVSLSNQGMLTVTLDGHLIFSGTTATDTGACGILADPHSHASVTRFEVQGHPQPAILTYLPEEGLLNAGQSLKDWQREESPLYRFGYGYLGDGTAIRAKWSFQGTGCRLWAPVGKMSGTAKVYIDGLFISDIDFGAHVPTPSSIVFSVENLEQGNHVLTLLPTGGTMVLDSLDVLTR